MHSGRGVGVDTLLQNLCKMLLNKKYFVWKYLAPRTPWTRCHCGSIPSSLFPFPNRICSILALKCDIWWHSNNETLSKFQARISEHSSTDFWSPSTSVPVGHGIVPVGYGILTPAFYCWLCQWQNCQNRWIYDKVTKYNYLVTYFLWTTKNKKKSCLFCNKHEIT